MIVRGCEGEDGRDGRGAREKGNRERECTPSLVLFFFWPVFPCVRRFFGHWRSLKGLYVPFAMPSWFSIFPAQSL